MKTMDEWSLLFQIESQLPTNNVNTSNYAEVSFRVTKDLKFNRHRASNQLELLTIECDDSAYYTQCCILMLQAILRQADLLTKTIGEQWSFFWSDGMVIFFWGLLNHHH